MAAAAMHPDLEALLAEADAAADPEVAAARADAAELVGLAPATALARALAFRHPGLRPDQLSEIAAAAIRPAPAAAAAADGPRLPALDTDRLFERCPVVARRVADVSATLGVQRSAPAMCALFLASTAAADRLRLKVPQLGEPWIMPLHLFGLVALASGGNKSATQKAMGLGAGGVDLLAELERWAADQVADDAAADRFARHMAAQRAAKAKDAAEAVAADKVLRRPPIHVPRVRLDDVTPESFVRRAQESGYVAMHCDEMKDALDTFLGRKAGEDRLDVILKTFSGVKHTRARVGEDREGRAVRFEELHASVLWWSQPAVVSGQVPENRDRLAAAADRGLFARFLVAMPERQPDPQPVGDDAAATREAYLEHMRRLLLAGAGGDHPLAPRVGGETFHGYTAVVDEDAAARVLAYQARCRRDGQEGGRWHESRYLRAAAPRLGELAARLAGLLALLRVGELRHDIAVDLDDVERAIEALEGYFIPHLEALVEAAESSPVEVLARKVYGILEAKGPMTETDLLRGPLARAREFEVLSHAERRTPLLAALEWLQRRGLVVGEKAKPSAKALTWHPQIRHPFGAGRVAGQEVR